MDMSAVNSGVLVTTVHAAMQVVRAGSDGGSGMLSKNEVVFRNLEKVYSCASPS